MMDEHGDESENENERKIGLQRPYAVRSFAIPSNLQQTIIINILQLLIAIARTILSSVSFRQ